MVAALALLASLAGSQGTAETRPRLRSGAVTSDDYPADAIRAGEEGSTRFALSISEAGRVTGCRIVESSGSAALDEASCRIAVERYIFSPGRNARGEPVQSSYTQTVRWRLPEYRGLSFGSFSMSLTATFQNGRLATCSQRNEQGVTEAVPHSVCSAMFSGGNDQAIFPLVLRQVTQFIAFAPAGAPLPGPAAEWGRMLAASEAQMRIGPDGRIISCTTVRSEVAPDVPGMAPNNGCGLSGLGGSGFEPADVPERTGRTFIATYAVITPAAN